MDIYFAPLEGITGFRFRKVYEKHFPGQIRKYYSPFIATNQHMGMKTRDKLDVLPENNQGICLIPQILSGQEEQFLDMVGRLENLGYEEINLNLGCPSKTVVTKKKGSGFLAYPEDLDRFLEKIYGGCPHLKISIKTRLGIQDPEEFYKILEIYNQYPLSELIIHPRVQLDYYKNVPRREIFRESLKLAKMPVCYNGDLFTKEDLDAFEKEFPQVPAVMLGRGLLKCPSLLLERQGESRDLQQWRAFMEELCLVYEDEMYGGKNVLFKMKELWYYLFLGLPEKASYVKQMKKTTNLELYKSLTREILG